MRLALNHRANGSLESEYTEKYNCGGESRKWYGNHNNVVYWKNRGERIKNDSSSVIRNEENFFKQGITWKRIGSSDFFLRFLPEGFIFDQSGDAMFPKDVNITYYILGFVNSAVAIEAFKLIAPTLNLTAGNINKLPIIYSSSLNIEDVVKENIKISKEDWDSHELSWDYKRNFLI